MNPERWEKIDRIFHEALARPEESRAGYLEKACAGDEELRSEIKKMLEADQVSASILDHSYAELASIVQEDQGRVSEKIGRYKVIRELGKGGMGKVYLAARADGQFEMQVAIKVVKRGMDSDEILRRFRLERQLLAGLKHPKIARLLDGGLTADGLPYLVMEYVGGLSIDEYCDSHHLNVRERLALFSQVCEAVQYAHNNLVVHRDIKPSNILVTESGKVKLLDFGIAKLLDESGEDGEVPVTKTGRQLMTPEYAAPEQISAGRITTATDVYALGVLLYELLTGTRPFSGINSNDRHNPVRPSVAATKADHGVMNQTGSGRLRQQLKGDLDNIVLQALKEDPNRRYPSAESFREDVQRYLSNLPVQARSDTFSYRAQKFVRRHRLGVVASSTVFLTLLAFAITTKLQSNRIEAERQVADQVSTFMEDLFAGADPFSEQEGRIDTLRVREFLTRGVHRVNNDLEEQPELQGRLLSVLGNVHYKLGLYSQAESLLVEAYDLSVGYSRSSIETAGLLQILGGLYEETGRLTDAEREYSNALEIYTNEYGRGHPSTAQAMSQLGYLHRLKGDLDQAEPLIRNALEISRKNIETPGIGFANSLTRFGILLQEKGDLLGAADIHHEALEVRRNLFPPGHPRLATSVANLAVVLIQLCRLDEAEPLVMESQAIVNETAMEEDHLKVAHTSMVLGNLRRLQGHLEESEDALNVSVEMFEDLFGDANRLTIAAKIALGNTLNQSGNGYAAAQVLEGSIATIETALASDHPLMIEALTTLAESYQRQARLDSAGQFSARAHELAQSTNQQHPRNADAAFRLGMIRIEQGDFTQAEMLLKESLELRNRILPDGHIDVLQSRIWREIAIHHMGSSSEESDRIISSSLDLLHETYGNDHPTTIELRLHLTKYLPAASIE